jgi:hypothetical protein
MCSCHAFFLSTNSAPKWAPKPVFISRLNQKHATSGWVRLFRQVGQILTGGSINAGIEEDCDLR